jgi:hypothetical protein
MMMSSLNEFGRRQPMFNLNLGGLLVIIVFAAFSLTAQAASTNTFNFNNTTATTTSGNGVGPINPTNGVTSISGASLNAGDVVLFDGVVIDVPGSGSDAWGSVDLNGSGYGGVVYAALGVLAETGTTSGNQCQLFLNGSGSSTKLGISQGYRTNRVQIILTCTKSGSTTNMNYSVKIDQGVTGIFSATTSGTGVTFANNTIALNFGANNATHLFIQTQPIITVSAPTPATATVAAGVKATFAVTITQGYPLSTAQQWLSNGVPIIGATNLTYTTPPVTASYNGVQYNIIVTNLLTAGNIVTSAAATLNVRSVPGMVPFIFSPTTIPNSSQVNPLNPPAAISGLSLLTGDTVVFDGIVTTNGPLTGSSNGWASINLAAGGYQGTTAAQLGLLVRLGAGASQIYLNRSGPISPNPTSSGALTNRARIELYPSVTGSTTNMGWLVEIDQNLTGTFLPAVTGTNLTFTNNTIPLSFGADSVAGLISPYPIGLQSIQQQLATTNQILGGFDQVVVTGSYLNLSNVVISPTTPGLVYVSSNTNVVTVSSNGFLQAVGVGQATVTSTLSGFSAGNVVSVIDPGTLLSITLVVSNQMALYSNQQAIVTGTFSNVTNVNMLNYGQTTFIHNNPNIVSVSASGLVTAVAPGSTVLGAVNGSVTSVSKQIVVTYPTNRFIFDTFSDGFWNIINQGNANNLVLNSSGASQAVSTNTTFDQQFELLYNYQNSSFRIRNRTTWQCLGAKFSNLVGSSVIPVTYTGATSQQWYLVDVGNGYFRIVNSAYDLVLQTDNGNPASVTLANASSSAFQYWSFSYQTHFPKKGSAGYEGDYSQLGLNWAYNYDDNTSVSLPPSVNFVPMIYAAQYYETLGDAQTRDAGWLATAQPNYLMTYNEPDNTAAGGGSNTSTNDAIGAWPQIQALDLPLVSPAVQNTFDSWEYNFFSLIASNSYRVDYTAVHEYVPPNAASLMGVLQSTYNTWGRPVWLTEFSPVDWSNTKSWSENDDYNFLAEFMWQAEGQEWLKRYSIFPFTGTNSVSPWVDNGYTGTMFLDASQTLSPYGELYAAWDADLTLHARTPYIIHNLGTSFRLTDTNNVATPKASTIYVRNATTEWALLPAPTTNHWYIISLNDGRRLRNNGGTLDLAPYGTTNSAVDWWFNGPDGNGYYYLDNLAASQSIQGGGTAPSISFSMINDPAPSTATQWRFIKPYQPVTIAAAVSPAVTISYNSQSATLSWAGNGSYYNIYRSLTSGGPYTNIVNLATNVTYTDGFLQNGTAYYYVVTMLNILGDESAYSNEVVARPASATILPVSFTTLNNGLQFTWPSDHIGWRLIMNTNGLANAGAWVTVPNSAATNSEWLLFDTTQSNVFFRLIYP